VAKNGGDLLKAYSKDKPSQNLFPDVVQRALLADMIF
jgi:hypothetical protein